MKECLRLITERRSITFFDPTKEVPDELIKEILEISATAPSGYNLQPWEVVVVKDKEKKRQLKDVCYGQQKVEDASANIVFIANPRAGFEHVDKVLDSWVELGYIPKEAKGKLKENIRMDRQREGHKKGYKGYRPLLYDSYDRCKGLWA
jgi:putative NAD(P)H nitroreductase